MGQAVTGGAENTSSYPKWPHSGHRCTCGTRSESKGWGRAAHGKGSFKGPTVASRKLHSKPVRKEVLPHFMCRAPQMGVSASAPKMGSPVAPNQILSPCSGTQLLLPRGPREAAGSRALAFASPSRDTLTQVSSPSPIFLSLALTTAPNGTPSEAPAWPHQPSSLTRAPIVHLSYPCWHRFQRDDHPLRLPFLGVLAASSLHCRPCPTVHLLAWVLLVSYLLPLAASHLPPLAASRTGCPPCLRLALGQEQIKAGGLQGLMQQGRLPARGGGLSWAREQGRFGRGRKGWSRSRSRGTAGGDKGIWGEGGKRGCPYLKDPMSDSGAAW